MGSGPSEPGFQDPRLPAELEREIFEAAALHDHATAKELVLVAQRVRTWIDPILHNVILQTLWKPALPNYPPLYKDLGRMTKGPRFKEMTSWAKHVGLQNLKVSQAIQILESCVNVQDLALWIIVGPHEPLRKIIRNLPVQRLHVDIERFFSEDPIDGPKLGRFNFDHIPLINITHLHIFLLPIVPWAQWKSIALLPRLSHLAIDNWHPEFIRKVLEECKSLNLLVVVSSRITSYDFDPISRRDPRLTELIESQWIASWERGALTGNDIWSRAEAARAEKREERRRRHRGVFPLECFSPRSGTWI